jgi:signal transduction histidine kinase
MADPAPATILNVNDNPANRQARSLALQQSGFRVLETETSEEALKTLTSAPEEIDLVLIEGDLPGIDSREVCHRLKADLASSPIPVLRIAAPSVPPDATKRPLDSGADAYLRHSFEPHELLAIVHSLLRLRKAEQSLAQRERVSEEEHARRLEGERAAREEAERVIRMKDEFLTTLSHELRTPLQAILGWVHLMKSHSLGAEELARGVATIERNARAQAQLIGDLLDMSRIISGKLRLDVHRIQVGGVIEAAVESVRPGAEAKGIRLQMVLDPLAGPIAGDPNRLQQVVWNLLSNAIKFTPQGGRVQVVLERVRSQIEISVRDTGQGIAPEFLAHVFERFRQADASTTRQHMGLGLGLAIVKHLTELHGGTVRAMSQGEGQGATFTILLPVSLVQTEETEERSHPRAETEPVAVCPVSLDGVCVLVVEDEPDTRELIARLLIEYAAEVTTVASAREALDLLPRERPDVIISDIGMPLQDGYDLIRSIRELPTEQGGKTPALALTAFARSEDRTRAVLAGYQMHLAKPVEPSELIAMVASLAGRTSLPRSD